MGSIWETENLSHISSVCHSPRLFPKEQKPPDHCLRPHFAGERERETTRGAENWEAAFIALAQQERRGLPTYPQFELPYCLLQTTSPTPLTTPYCLWCSTKSFLPGHCGQYGVPASRVLNQKEAAVACPAEGLQSSPACVQRVSEIYMVSAWLPPLPDNEVFLEEAPLVRMRSLPDSHVPPGLPTK